MRYYSVTNNPAKFIQYSYITYIKKTLLHSSFITVLQVKLSQLIYKAVEGANDVIICVVIDQGFASSNTTLQVNTTVSVTSTGK